MAEYAVQVGGSTQTRYEDKLLDGILVLEHPGYLAKIPGKGDLYYSAAAAAPAEEHVPLTLIPYYTWANREATEMQAWIPYGTS